MAYRAPEPLQSDEDVLKALQPYNCEWFRRPEMGLSMLAQATTECLPVMEAFSGDVLNETFVAEIKEHVYPVLPALTKMNNKNKQQQKPTPQDLRSVMRFALKEDPSLDTTLDQGIEAVSASLTLLTQVRAMRALFRNPEQYAEQTGSTDGSHGQFMQDGDVRSLEKWLALKALPKAHTMRPAQNLLARLEEPDHVPARARVSRRSRPTAARRERTPLPELFSNDEEEEFEEQTAGEDEEEEDDQPAPVPLPRPRTGKASRHVTPQSSSATTTIAASSTVPPTTTSCGFKRPVGGKTIKFKTRPKVATKKRVSTSAAFKPSPPKKKKGATRTLFQYSEDDN